ncbi:MAG: lipocalin-like domain-containing protein [Bacteroidales bacterium]|nr:lipocalin-like domain-containing protein [Bacteroidales bacterium]
MKRLLLAFPLLSLLSMGSCDLEMSDNGALDGYWQLARIDTIGGGGCDMVSSRIFWSVQLHLLQLSDHSGRNSTYLLRFDQDDSRLRVYEPYLSNRNEGDMPLTDAIVLQPYGIQSLDEQFEIIRLDKDCLSLKSSLLELSFNRY